MRTRLATIVVLIVSAFVGVVLSGQERVRAYSGASIVRLPASGFLAGSISSGEYHSCGIRTGGSVLCWGIDVNGQVDGNPVSTAPYYASGSPPGGGTYTQISAGGGHTCGIRSNSTVLCWGDDEYGQVDGKPVTSSPYYASGSPPRGGTFTQVSVGEYHTCGVRTNGNVFCWGDDEYGGVDGNPVSTSPYYASGSPPGGGTFTQVSVGGNHTCGVKTDGTVFCWGNDQFGQVDGNPVIATPYYASGSSPGGGTYTQVSAGGDHTCGVKTDGTVLCWGFDEYGQVDGNPVVATPYYASGSPSGGGTYTQISAGDYHTCGVKTDGTVFCWGYDYQGQTNGTPVTTGTFYGQGSPPGGGYFLQISAGGYHTCGIRYYGATFCWGYDPYGQTNGSPVSTSPHYGQGAAPGGGYFSQAAVSAGGSHTCQVLYYGYLSCSGDDTYGQLDGVPSTTTRTHLWSSYFVQVSAGLHHTCALTPSRTAQCWGSNASGQTSAPTGNFLQLASGGSHTCGLRSNRSMVCWGDEHFVAAGPFIQITAGLNHSCGVLANYQVRCWGDNSAQQAPALSPGPYVQVSGGDLNTCALQLDSTLQCWGSDAYAQSDAPFDTFAQVAAGTSHSCGLRTDATALCWGLNSSGQSDAPAGSYLSVSAGGSQSCGVQANGTTILCWGASTSYSSTIGPSYTKLKTTIAKGWTTVTWRGVKQAVGYNVLSHGTAINDTLVKSETHSYRFRVRGIIRHIKLSAVERLPAMKSGPIAGRYRQAADLRPQVALSPMPVRFWPRS